MKYIHVTPIILAVILVIGTGIIAFHYSEDIGERITGKTIARVYITETPPANCTVILREGVNIISFYCEPGGGSLDESLRNQEGQVLPYKAVFRHNPLNPQNPWQIYNPSLPNYTVQTLSTLDRRRGYYIIMEEEGTYHREGFGFQQTTISLSQGWNLIGYPSSQERNITQAINSIEGSITRVETYEYENGNINHYYYIPGIGGTLDSMKPYHAYWIHASQAVTWLVNW